MTGNEQPDGNFSGLMGYVQRGVSFSSRVESFVLFTDYQVADYMYMAVKMEGYSSEPVHFSSVAQAIDLVIVSPNIYVQSNVSDLTTALLASSNETYWFLLICLTLVAIIMSVPKNIRDRQQRQLLFLLKKYLYNVEQQLALLVDQENLTPNQLIGQNLIWLILTIIMFVFIFCYLLNMMSTDLVTIHRLATAENLNDLMTSFKEMRLFMLTILFFYDYMKRAPPTSPIGQLYRRMEATTQALIVSCISTKRRSVRVEKRQSSIFRHFSSFSNYCQ